MDLHYTTFHFAHSLILSRSLHVLHVLPCLHRRRSRLPWRRGQACKRADPLLAPSPPHHHNPSSTHTLSIRSKLLNSAQSDSPFFPSCGQFVSRYHCFDRHGSVHSHLQKPTVPPLFRDTPQHSINTASKHHEAYSSGGRTRCGRARGRCKRSSSERQARRCH
jgi:hypothetical protein